MANTEYDVAGYPPDTLDVLGRPLDLIDPPRLQVTGAQQRRTAAAPDADAEALQLAVFEETAADRARSEQTRTRATDGDDELPFVAPPQPMQSRSSAVRAGGSGGGHVTGMKHTLRERSVAAAPPAKKRISEVVGSARVPEAVVVPAAKATAQQHNQQMQQQQRRAATVAAAEALVSSVLASAPSAKPAAAVSDRGATAGTESSGHSESLPWRLLLDATVSSTPAPGCCEARQ